MKTKLMKYSTENKLNIDPNIPELGSMFTVEQTSFNFVKKSSYLKRGEIDNLIEDFGILEIKDSYKHEDQDKKIRDFYYNLFSCNAFVIELVGAYDNIICANNILKYNSNVLIPYNKDHDMVLEFYDFLLTSKNVYSKCPAIIEFIKSNKDSYLFELEKFTNEKHKDRFYTNNLKEPAIYNNVNLIKFFVDNIVSDYVLKQSFLYTYTGTNREIYDTELADELRKKNPETELQINMEIVRELLTISNPNNMLLPLIINLISLKIKAKNIPQYIYLDYKVIKNKINEDEVINLIYNLYNAILIKIYDRLKNSDYIKEFREIYGIHTNMNIYEKFRKHVVVTLRGLQSQNKDSINMLNTNGYDLHIKTEQLIKVVLARLTFKGKFTKDIIGFISQIIQREFQYFFNREFKIKKLPYQLPDDVGDDNSNTVPHIDNAVYDALIRMDSSKRILFLNDIESIKRIICRKFSLNYESVINHINMILNNNEKYIPSRFSVATASGVYSLYTGNNMLSSFLSLGDVLFMNIAMTHVFRGEAIRPFFLTSVDPNGKRPSNIDNIVNKSTSILRSIMIEKSMAAANAASNGKKKEEEEVYIMDNSFDAIMNDFKLTLTKPLITYYKTMDYGQYNSEIMGDIVTNKDNIILIIMNYISCRDRFISSLNSDILSIYLKESQKNAA